jgi:hypothetical protein
MRFQLNVALYRLNLPAKECEGDVPEPLCCSLTEGFSDDGRAALVSARVWLGSLLMVELPEAQIDAKCDAKSMCCWWLLALSRGGVASWMTVVRCRASATSAGNN